ncbi:ankyrin [Acetobacter aceti 1023]|nr:ankyrin [Acetobacter aceti 1023]
MTHTCNDGQTMTRFCRLASSALLMGGFACFAATPVWAQGGEEAEAAEAAKKAEAAQDAKRAAPPTNIPGAAGLDEDDGDKSNKDVEPTAALFDAINRGSISAAKDAINRGADLHGHNILGQTPLDMSIDLNRNPITFLLLSLRSPPDSSRSYGGNMDDGGAEPVVSGGINNARYEQEERQQDKRYDSTGGTAQPSIGFLGFGGS